MMNVYPKAFLDLINSIKTKRPRTVIQHILQHGFVTSQELKELYGYNHPPRAARDVREQGIPLETYRIEGTDGRRIAAYRFGKPDTAKNKLSKSAGRTALSKALKQALIEKYGSKCFVYFEAMDESLLQVDHRIPYEIGGEQNELNIESFMLLSPSANRAKSWVCEHCKNWERKDVAFCVQCFWAYPEDYEHIAGKQQRIISIIFTGNEIEDYNRLIEISGIDKAQQVIKDILADFFDRK
ncbi:MAG: helix-turn-helix domain-containing protein [Desulfovibrio sp.]|jgi:hypothetical protein|nr:helix-turn-helix domain-containing protein [Desulfovibrio sp.]